MQFSDRIVAGITVVDITGTLKGSDNLLLRERMAGLLKDGHRRFILNFAELSYLDSAALGELIACQLRASKAGGTMKLANAGRRIQDLLLLTRLITVFDAHDSLQAALESYKEADRLRR